ncbi:MAG: redoxin domain-containing protein [Alphaproteobacteria bacterium]|nr:redoxin domain-containing protein [Alphaproteobacteria bacterium]
MSSVVHAPEIAVPGARWFNVARPLDLAALRGRLVILDFWALCCINCLHMIPILRRVETMFPDHVTVIGVHSPKFRAERDPDLVAAAIARWDIRHPVIHDPDLALWHQYTVRGWPTLVFVSPDGKVLGQHSGEPEVDKLLEVVDEILIESQNEGMLDPHPIALADPAAPAPAQLRFPAKIKRVPGAMTRWAVADSGHNQIVLFDDAGGEIARFGDGSAGFEDGLPGEASFANPQGLAATEAAIFVADTGNHAIRRIALATGEVATLAGVGRRGPVLRTTTSAFETWLASPWDLALAGRQLFFANAGTHQIGVLDLEDLLVTPFAGSGHEEIVDGAGGNASLAQPSGLDVDPAGTTLYIADAETSAVRAVALDGSAEVRTLIGAGLFEFGHRDGPFADALLQHPLAVAAADGRVLVADSFNHAVRVLDLARRRVDDLDGGRLVCTDPVCLPLAEPAGIALDGRDRVLIADGNNHRIVEVRLDTGTSRTWA